MQVTSKRATVAIVAGAAFLIAATGAPGATRCSIYSVPTLDVAPAAQTTLTPGVPSVLVCVDGAGNEFINNVVLAGARS